MNRRRGSGHLAILTLLIATGAVLLTSCNIAAFVGTDLEEPAFLVEPGDVQLLRTTDGAELSWADRCRIEQGYVIQRASNSPTFSDLATTETNATEYLDATAPDAGSITYYRVSAVDAEGVRSSFSAPLRLPDEITYAVFQDVYVEYLFGGDTSDSSGNGRDGNGYDLLWTSDRHGTADSALRLNGYSTYVELPDLPLSSFPLSVSVWIKPDDYFNQVAIFVTDDFDPTDSQAHGLAGYIDTDGSIGGIMGSGGIDHRIWGWTPSSALSTTEWHHLVFVFEDETSFTLYVNGDEKTTTATDYGSPTGIADGGRSPRVGQDHDSWGGSFFDGGIDDFRIWTRTLAAEDISALYAE